MSSEPTSNKRDHPGMTADEAKRFEAMTEDEINTAAMSDPENRSSTPEQLAQFRRPAFAKALRQKLKMGQETFARVYGIPLQTLQSWERHEIEPTPAEFTYLRLIEREPELAQQKEKA